MKTPVLLTACLTTFCLTAFTFCSFAQTEKRNVIKTNLLSPLLRAVHLNYEYGLSKKTSAQLGFMYLFGVQQTDTKFTGFGITPEFRFYPQENATQGFFLALSPRYQSHNLEVSITDNNGNPATAEATWSSVGAAFLVGNQWHFPKSITLELYGGPSYNVGNIKVKSGSEENFNVGFLSGFGLRFGLMIGIAF
jgi:hypothetical protein